MKTAVLRLETLSDDALLARLDEVLGRERRVEAELVWHLAEVDRRRLYLREACPSMFVYATSRLGLSEAEAYLRITVARVSRRFPSVLAMLADGRLHLSAIARLAPHLRDEDGEELLQRAVGRSRRAIEMIVAELAPKPDVPARMRRLPAPAPPELRPDGVGHREVTAQTAPVAAPDRTAPVPTASGPTGPAAVVAPLAPSRFRVQFTAGAELHDKIARAQALLRREIPSGDLAEVFDRAVTLLVAHLERTKFAATPAPRKTVEESDPTPSSRHIPDPIRRAVWERDGGQCTFHDRQGRRCPARERLEFHHDVPFGRGGDHAATNIRIYCALHNAYQAELDYGAAWMAACRRTSAAPRPPPDRPADGSPHEEQVQADARRATAERDTLDALQRMGVRASDARQAVAEASRSSAAHLEQMLRESLRYLGRTTYASRAREEVADWPAAAEDGAHAIVRAREVAQGDLVGANCIAQPGQLTCARGVAPPRAASLHHCAQADSARRADAEARHSTAPGGSAGGTQSTPAMRRRRARPGLVSAQS